MSRLRHPAVVTAAAVVLAAVFVYASLDKIARPREFASIVYHYRLVGPNATLGFVPANLVAVVLPWIELICGALLIAGCWRREAAVTTAGMLVTFLVAVGWALAQGIDIENCGCFSVSGAGRRAGAQLLLGDVALFGLALLVAAGPQRAPAAAAASVDVPEAGR